MPLFYLKMRNPDVRLFLLQSRCVLQRQTSFKTIYVQLASLGVSNIKWLVSLISPLRLFSVIEPLWGCCTEMHELNIWASYRGKG